MGTNLCGNDGCVKITVLFSQSGLLPPNVRYASPGDRSERGGLRPFVKRGSDQPPSSTNEKGTALCAPQVAPRQWRFFLRTL